MLSSYETLNFQVFAEPVRYHNEQISQWTDMDILPHRIAHPLKLTATLKLSAIEMGCIILESSLSKIVFMAK